MSMFANATSLCIAGLKARTTPPWRRCFLPTLCWVRVTDSFETHIQIFNYLPYLGARSDARACVEIEVFSERGRRVASWQDVLGSRESRFVNVRDFLKKERAFQGSATVRLWSLDGIEGMIQPPVWTTEFFTKYWTHGHGGSIVHNLQAVSYVPFTHPGWTAMASPIWVDDQRDTSIILFNSYWNNALWAREYASPRLFVSNHAGTVREWATPGTAIPPRGSKAIHLREMSGLAEFLDGQWGGIRVEAKNVPKRFLIWVQDRHSADFNIHHN